MIDQATYAKVLPTKLDQAILDQRRKVLWPIDSLCEEASEALEAHVESMGLRQAAVEVLEASVGKAHGMDSDLFAWQMTDENR
jgi:hypothetical protein